MPIRRGNERAYERVAKGLAGTIPGSETIDEQQDQIGKRRERYPFHGGRNARTSRAAACDDEEEAILFGRPFTVLGHGSLQSQLRCGACCAMQRARNREPRLIKRRRAIVNDTPRLVVKDRGISKRVTAVTLARSIDRNSLRDEERRRAERCTNTRVCIVYVCT